MNPGHAAGDQLLRGGVASPGGASGGRRAARVGGDEFVVLLDDVTTTDEALLVAERLASALRQPYALGDERLAATASIGVAVGPQGLGSADDIVAAADAAMYDAKRRGGDRFVLYSEAAHGRAAWPPGDSFG